MKSEDISIFLINISNFLLYLQHNSDAYDRGEQEIQTDFHGGTYG